MWTVSVKAGQSEQNGTRMHDGTQARRHARTMARMHEGTHAQPFVMKRLTHRHCEWITSTSRLPVEEESSVKLHHLGGTHQ